MKSNEVAAVVTLAQALRDTPDATFFKAGTKTPNYNAAFVHCAKVLYKGARQTAKMLLDGIEAGGPINLSSFQRAVAKERERRGKVKA